MNGQHVPESGSFGVETGDLDGPTITRRSRYAKTGSRHGGRVTSRWWIHVTAVGFTSWRGQGRRCSRPITRIDGTGSNSGALEDGHRSRWNTRVGPTGTPALRDAVGNVATPSTGRPAVRASACRGKGVTDGCRGTGDRPTGRTGVGPLPLCFGWNRSGGRPDPSDGPVVSRRRASEVRSRASSVRILGRKTPFYRYFLPLRIWFNCISNKGFYPKLERNSPTPSPPTRRSTRNEGVWGRRPPLRVQRVEIHDSPVVPQQVRSSGRPSTVLARIDGA